MSATSMAKREQRARLTDLPIDYQRLRHTTAARLMRRAIYRLVIGPEGWPLVFRAPEHPEEVPAAGSPHLYVHLPFCRRICPHCPYNKVRYSEALHRSYGPALLGEIDAYLAQPGRPVVQSLYLGGGTPTCTPDLIAHTIERVRPYMAPGAEVGVEVHPADATPERLWILREMGVTRISLGIETFHDPLLRRIGRSYTGSDAHDALSAAREAGFECVDANLIYGIPGQTVDEAVADVAHCLALDVDQISAYPLLTFAHTALGQQVAEHRYPVFGDRARVHIQGEISRRCRAAGLVRTSVWSFTRAGIAPYSTVTHEDYVGFGAGAGSKVGGLFWFNTFSVPDYASAAPGHPALILQAPERFRRCHWLYWQIYRTEIDPARYEALFGRDLEHDFGRLLRVLRAFHMAEREDRRWRLTEFGAIWGHRLQALYSLAYIDDLWTRCRGEAWPREVALA